MEITALTTTGLLRGREEAGVVVFRGVPYAACDRFRPPVPAPAREGERQATADGPIAPRWPSRLEPVMANAVERVVGAAAFSRPSRRLALRLSRNGARVWVYRFDYAAPASPFGATHCIELPFLLGTDADWAAAPILAGADPGDIDILGRQMRSAWIDFIRTGTPGAAWPRFTPSAPVVHHLGAVGS